MQAANRIGVFNGNVIVVNKGKTIYKAAVGFADGSKQYPLTLPKRFDIGSIAKEFNGLSIMLLSERGKLSVTDPVRKYLPELPAWADSIQIAQLLNYTSGLPASPGNTKVVGKASVQRLSQHSGEGESCLGEARFENA